MSARSFSATSTSTSTTIAHAFGLTMPIQYPIGIFMQPFATLSSVPVLRGETELGCSCPCLLMTMKSRIMTDVCHVPCHIDGLIGPGALALTQLVLLKFCRSSSCGTRLTKCLAILIARHTCTSMAGQAHRP